MKEEIQKLQEQETNECYSCWGGGGMYWNTENNLAWIIQECSDSSSWWETGNGVCLQTCEEMYSTYIPGVNNFATYEGICNKSSNYKDVPASQWYQMGLNVNPCCRGCMDENALNYNPTAIYDEGQECEYPEAIECNTLQNYLNNNLGGMELVEFCDKCIEGALQDEYCECCPRIICYKCDKQNNVVANQFSGLLASGGYGCPTGWSEQTEPAPIYIKCKKEIEERLQKPLEEEIKRIKDLM